MCVCVCLCGVWCVCVCVCVIEHIEARNVFFHCECVLVCTTTLHSGKQGVFPEIRFMEPTESYGGNSTVFYIRSILLVNL